MNLDDVSAWLKIVLLKSCACVRLEALHFLDLSSVPNADFHCCSWVLIIILAFILKGPFWSFVDLKRIEAFFLDLDLKVASLLFGIFIGLVDIRGIIIDFSNCNGPKFLPEIIPWDKEDAIFFVWIKANSFLFIWIHMVPVLIIVRPSSLELSLSPRISQLNQPHLLSLDIQDVDLQESVGMALDHSGLACISIRAWVRRADHGVFELRSSVEVVPLFLLIGPFFGINLLNWSSSEIVKGFFGIASFSPFVACVELRPSFF
jgi:hypothetical protein